MDPHAGPNIIKKVLYLDTQNHLCCRNTTPAARTSRLGAWHLTKRAFFICYLNNEMASVWTSISDLSHSFRTTPGQTVVIPLQSPILGLQLHHTLLIHLPCLVLTLIHSKSSSCGKLLNSPMMFHWVWRFADPSIAINAKIAKTNVLGWILQKSHPNNWNARINSFLDNNSVKLHCSTIHSRFFWGSQHRSHYETSLLLLLH